jgi:single-strand DNA-binding protein
MLLKADKIILYLYIILNVDGLENLHQFLKNLQSKQKSKVLAKQSEYTELIHLGQQTEKNLKKGMLIYLEGKLTHRTWQDKDGNNRKTTEVVAEYFRIVNSRQGGTGTGNFPSEKDDPYNRSNNSNVSEAPMPTSSEEFTPAAADDDLPF